VIAVGDLPQWEGANLLQRRLAMRLNSNGSFNQELLVIPSFVPGFVPECGALLPDRKYLLGSVPGVGYGLSRWHADGNRDTNFNVSADSVILCSAVQADGKIIVGGYFKTINGVARDSLARLHPDGTVDWTFTLSPTNSGAVHALAIEPDGRLMAGGSFSRIAGVNRPRLARLNHIQPGSQTLSWDGSDVWWNRSGSVQELNAAGLEGSVDGVTWVQLGDAERTETDWRWDGTTTAPNALLRARGRIGNGKSSWLLESVVPTGPVSEISLSAIAGAPESSGDFAFGVHGSFGHVAVIEVSTNLLHWAPLGTNRISTQPFIFKDPFATQAIRYYRARVWAN